MTQHPISDHALVRWLERHHGLDVERFRQELLDIAKPALDIGASVAPLPGGLYLLIQDGKVVTVTPSRPHSRLPPLHYAGEGAPHWKHRTRRRFK